MGMYSVLSINTDNTYKTHKFGEEQKVAQKLFSVI